MSKQRDVLLGNEPKYIDKTIQTPDELESLRKKEETLKKEEVTKEVVEFAQNDPDRASRILRYWLVDKEEDI